MEFVSSTYNVWHKPAFANNSLASFYFGNELSFIFRLRQIQHHLQLQRSVPDLG